MWWNEVNATVFRESKLGHKMYAFRLALASILSLSLTHSPQNLLLILLCAQERWEKNNISKLLLSLLPSLFLALFVVVLLLLLLSVDCWLPSLLLRSAQIKDRKKRNEENMRQFFSMSGALNHYIIFASISRANKSDQIHQQL